MRRAKTLFILLAIRLVAFIADQNVRALTPDFPIDQPVSASDAQPQSWPAVAFNGSVYVVVWQDEQSDGDVRIRYARFDASGQPIGGMQTLPVMSGYGPAIASNGQDFLVLWNRAASPGPQTLAARLDSDGNYIANSVIGPIVIGDFPKVGSNGADYMVFTASPVVAVSRVTSGGFGPIIRTVSSDLGSSPAIASDGDSYLVVWVRNRDGLVLGAHVSAIGNWVEPAPFQIASIGAINTSVAFSNGMYLVVWQQALGADLSYNLMGQRITREGTKLDGTGFPITGTGTVAASAVGAFDDGFRVISYRFDYAANELDVRTFAVSTNGVVGRKFVLQTFDSASIQQPAISARGLNALVAWAAFSSETHYDVFARFIPAEAEPGEIRILQPGPNIETAPAIGSGTNGFLVAWQDNRNSLTNRGDIYGRFIDPYGRLKGSGAFSIARSAVDESSPSVAAAGDHYLVAWRESGDSSPTGADVKAALFINDTVIKQFTICTMTNDQRAVAAASNGRDFLIVWRDSRSVGYDPIDGTRFGDDDIFGMHVTHDGELSGPENGFAISKAALEQVAPAIASNGTNYLVVWRDGREPQGNDHIYGAMVNAGETNTPLDFRICFTDANQRAPDVGSNGSDYFVVWRDSRNAGRPSIEIYGTPVSAVGKVADTNGIPLVPSSQGQREPSIAGIGADYLLSWLEVTPNPVPIFQAWTRIIHSDGTVGPSPTQLSGTSYDPDTLAMAGNRQTGIGLMASQIATAAPRVQVQAICLSNCPIALSVTTGADTRTLVWNVESDETYRIEYKNTLEQPTWQLLIQRTASVDGFLQVDDSSANATRFYRVVRP